MKIRVRNPDRELELAGPRNVGAKEAMKHLERAARVQVLGERLAPPRHARVSREISEEILPTEVYWGAAPGGA